MICTEKFVYVKKKQYLCTRKCASAHSCPMKHRPYMGDQTICMT